MKWFRRSLATDRELGDEFETLRGFLLGFVDDEVRQWLTALDGALVAAKGRTRSE
jgi:hypothetical protein